MSKLREILERACSELCLEITFRYPIEINQDTILIAFAMIHCLGSKNGMAIFCSTSDLQSRESELISLQYAYAILDEPRSDERFDIEEFKEMFSDWGWAGDKKLRPSWMH